MRRRADISRYELIELFPGTDPGLPMGVDGRKSVRQGDAKIRVI